MSFVSARIFSGALLAAFSLATFPAQAQRLPGSVHPEHYELTLIPDVNNATFTGSEKIDVLLDQQVTRSRSMRRRSSSRR